MKKRLIPLMLAALALGAEAQQQTFTVSVSNP